MAPWNPEELYAEIWQQPPVKVAPIYAMAAKEIQG
jgi:hypothetical protein